ncbi:hypothetical protein LPJ57_000803 [Coemansia sp. RSA 486]|nr:hypothetical protein LPJ57_000803 [Coemansia sp. RSA 486]KAJ2235903.1 Bud site selection protein, Revert to axial protein 1 [Coemansia sp. RSA 485]
MNFDNSDDLAYQVPLPSSQLKPYQHSNQLQAPRQEVDYIHSLDDLNAPRARTRGRSESDGFRTMSARSSDDRAPLTTYFGAQAWQRLSTALPQGVRDPLNIDELEREERLMPFTEMAVGEMGAANLSHQASINEPGSSRHLSQLTGSINGAGVSTGPMFSEKSNVGAIDWAYMQDHNLRTGGLPSLDQVLTRRTRAPLALRDFAVHCSVRQPQARRWLEFYMAARTHEKMCLAYDSDLRHAKARSHYASTDGYNARNSLFAATDAEPTSSGSNNPFDPSRKVAAHTAAMESLSRGGRGADDRVFYPEDADAGMGSPGSVGKDSKGAFRRSHRQSSRMALQIQSSAETIFLRYFRAALDPNLMQGAGSFWQSHSSASGSSAAAAAAAAASARARGTAGRTGKIGSLKRMLTQKPGPYGSRGISALRPTLDDPYHQGYGVSATDPIYGGPGSRDRSQSGAGSMYDNQQGRLGSTPSLTMSRDHLNTPITGDSDGSAGLPAQYMNAGTAGRGLGGAFSSSRHHLYYHMPWPPEILTDIEQRLLHDGAALDSSLFSEAILYAYDVLDTYYFPIFIADAVSRNVTRDHCVLRVLFAFFFLWFGFALPLALILLDHQPKAQRVWMVLPQFIGWWNMAVGFGGSDLLLAVMRKYQSPTMKETPGSAANNQSDPSNQQQQRQQQSWGTVGSHVGGWRRAWFSTRISVDMTATRMVRARSIRWFIGALFMTAISTAILCAVPGTSIYTN